jgi:hypothetical protein
MKDIQTPANKANCTFAYTAAEPQGQTAGIIVNLSSSRLDRTAAEVLGLED